MLMKRYILLLTLSVCVAATQAAAPKRPMLEQGKTWEYVYHHYDEGITPDPDGTYNGETVFLSWYWLEGDTIIDGRQYMKMYRDDEVRNKKSYYAAYREDEEGRVYVAEFRGEKDFKLIDFIEPIPKQNNDYP